jgi:hypothetical protein
MDNKIPNTITAQPLPSNGHKNSLGNNGSKTSLRLSRTQQAEDKMPDVLLSMHKDLYEHGRQAALSSGALEPLDEDIRILEEHAAAMAQETYREAFDPAQYEHDRLREVEFEKQKADREEAELAAKHASAALLEREQEFARTQLGLLPPKTSGVLMLAAVLVLAISIAPTLHDFIFISMTDELMNWFISILSASVVGVFITWGILGSMDATGHRTATNQAALIGGIVVSFGLGALRVAHAEGWGEIVFAVALTIVEVGTILMLEAHASALRAHHHEWTKHQSDVNGAAAQLEAARTHLARCNDRIAELNDGINKHIRYVEERSVRRYNIEEIKAAALKAVIDGYRGGIAETRGHVLGVEKK